MAILRRRGRDSSEPSTPAQQPASAPAPFEVRVSRDGTCTVGGASVVPADGEPVHEAALNHLHRLAMATGHSVRATVTDERGGHITPIEVRVDGSSHFVGEPTRIPEPAVEQRQTGPGTADEPGPGADRPERTAAAAQADTGPGTNPAPDREPGPAAPDPASASGTTPDSGTAPDSTPTAPDSATTPEPPPRPDTRLGASGRAADTATGQSAGTSAGPDPAAGPVPGHAEPEPDGTPPPPGAPRPAGPRQSAPAAGPVPDSGTGPGGDRGTAGGPGTSTAPAGTAGTAPPVRPAAPEPGSGPEPTGSGPAEALPTPPAGEDSAPHNEPTIPAYLSEAVRRINEAIRLGNITSAAAMAQQSTASAVEAFGEEHPHVLNLRELCAYVAYLAGDPARSIAISLDTARVRRRQGDPRAYQSVLQAAAAWRTEPDPHAGLRLGRELVELWSELASAAGPAASDIAQLEAARRRMERLAERARGTAPTGR